jgi:coenzyme F420 hydrogenase subunit beta
MSTGIRPRVSTTATEQSCNCLSYCPGYLVGSEDDAGKCSHQSGLSHLVGPTTGIWEGYAADPDLRFAASSGGALSALALYCLEQEEMAFVLHIAMDPEYPWLNRTVQSRNKEDLLARAGSRYAPASPCDSLQLIEQSDRPCVFIGKPCDTAAVQSLRKARPKLNENLGLVLTFFCAGTPSTRGTLDLIQSMHIDPGQIQTLHYRGNGWPGQFRVLHEGSAEASELSYETSWDKLEKHRPWRCHICPDGLGQVADVACGDAWHSFQHNGDDGRSLVLGRSKWGAEIVQRAMNAGYLNLTTTSAVTVVKAQAGLIDKRKQIFGRLFAMKVLMIPTPRFHGYALFRAWMTLPMLRRMKTIFGTLRRLLERGLWHRNPICEK